MYPIKFICQFNSCLEQMNTITEVSSSRGNRSCSQTSASRIIRDMATSTVTTIPQALKQPHENSVTSFEQYPEQQHPSPNSQEDFEKFTRKLLKNKSLLVPRRLALKRQRASLRPSSKHLEPLYTDTLQMELGNPGECFSRNGQYDDDLKTTVSQNLRLSSEQCRTQSLSNLSSPVREDTPHTLPTDISLLYRYFLKTNHVYLYVMISQCIDKGYLHI